MQSISAVALWSSHLQWVSTAVKTSVLVQGPRAKDKQLQHHTVKLDPLYCQICGVSLHLQDRALSSEGHGKGGGFTTQGALSLGQRNKRCHFRFTVETLYGR